MTDARPNPDNAQQPTPPAAPPTRPMRWLKYGTNVAVLVLATAAIVVMVNWIGYHNYKRFDFTQTRQYSLSAQTLELLNQLDADLQITTLYAAGTAEPELFRRVQDLLEEYNRRSPAVHVRQIDPTVQRSQFAEFTDQISDRFADELTANEQAIELATADLERVRRFAADQREQLVDLLPYLGQHQELALLVRQLDEGYARTGDNLREYEQQIEQTLDEDLPDFRAARDLALEPLSQWTQNILTVALDRFERALDQPGLNAEAEDALLGMQRDYQQLLDTLEDTVETLEDATSPGYDNLRQSLLQTNSLVVAMDEQTARDREDRGLVVLTLDEIYPNLVLSRVSQGEVRPEQGYKGEEVITGAVMRLTVQHDTRVVFINPSRDSVLTGSQPSSTYRLAAERLRQMNFQVEEWRSSGSVGPDGQPAAATPPPTAAEGERLVYVALPERRDPRITGDYESPAERAVREHIESGQPALLILRAKPPTNVSGPTALERTLAERGVTADRSRVAMHHTAGAGGRVRGTTQIPLADWPDQHDLSRALRGLRGVLLQSVPLTLEQPGGEDTQHWPLVHAPAEAWAGQDYAEAARARPRDDDPRGPFPIAAAVQQGDDRLVVIGDPAFATDMVAQSGPRNMVGQVMFSQFPANQELFVNSVYWLAGMDDLIAPGARTQDVRRIAAISDSQMRLVSWGLLAGLPAACLLAGLGVWFVRRQ